MVAGIQVADHAAHTLGVMLLEEAGIVRKSVLPGDNSGYEPDLEIELGFEVRPGLRYSFLGKDKLASNSPEVFDPHRIVEGFGLYVAPSCDDDLEARPCPPPFRQHLPWVYPLIPAKLMLEALQPQWDFYELRT